jgi:polyhydroxyalkanoate synthesis repressor PhaR
LARDTDQEGRPVIIKKYANRRLYNTDTSTYVTLEDLAEMVRGERDFVVYDAKTGEDLTHAVLTQIIVDQESRGTNLLPIGFLRQLIRFYGDSMQKLVPSYLEFSLDSLTRQQEQYRRRFANAFGTAAFDAMQEQVRKNFDTFERAFGMFTPFSGSDATTNGLTHEEAKEGAEAGPTPAAKIGAKPGGDDIDTLKAELLAMQQRLEKLSRN